MKTVIYYFSATGNSLKTAAIISQSLGADMLPMTKNKGVLCTADKIGLVFPTYFWGVPRTVGEFIDKLRISPDSPYMFAVSTYGELHGGVLGQVDRLLVNKGLKLNYGREIKAVANFVEEYNPRVHLAEKRLREAAGLAELAADEIDAGICNAPFHDSVLDKLFYRIYTDVKVNHDQGFHVDDTCIQCGICQNICPNHNIILKNGLLEFRHQCEHCVACINCCPQKAIQWKSATQKRNRYKHPDVTIKEIISGMQAF